MSREHAKLLELAYARFGAGNFSIAEQSIFAAAANGEMASAASGNEYEDDPDHAAAWGSERTIRAECINWLCTDPEASALVTYAGLHVSNARIHGELSLNYATIHFPLVIAKSVFDSPIWITDAHLRLLVLEGSHINGLEADRSTIMGAVLLRSGFRSTGAVSLAGAAIRGNIECDGATLRATSGLALVLDGATVEGSVFLRNGFEAHGEVRLSLIKVKGDVSCGRARFVNPTGTAFNADGARIDGSFFLQKGFTADGEVKLAGTRIGGSLACHEASFSKPNSWALAAEGIVVDGDILFRKGFRVEGGILLNGGTVGGSLDCSGACLLAPSGKALSAEGVNVGRSVRLRHGFEAKGEVTLMGASIGRNLDCDGAQLSNPNGKALNADSLLAAGSVFLRKSFKAEGEVNLLGAKIGRNLECDGAHLSNGDGKALYADALNAGGYVFLRNGFKTEGEVNLLGAVIGGNLECDAAQLSNPSGKCLNADRAKIQGSMFLRKGFKTEGEVNLALATIGGMVDCSGAQLSNANGQAFNAIGASIQRYLLLRDGFSAEGAVNLTGATIGSGLYIYKIRPFEKTVLNLRSVKTGTFWDDEESWPQADNLFIDGFRYERLHEKSPIRSAVRKSWLARQPRNEFLPQPYEQLASVLREMGHERDARHIMIEKNQAQARFTRRFRQGWWWYNVFGSWIGYGYAPWRALVASVVIILVGLVFFWVGLAEGLISPTKESAYEKSANGQFVTVNGKHKISDDYPAFNPFAFSLESFIPLLRFDQRDNWAPNPNSGVQYFICRRPIIRSGGVLRTFLCAYTTIGWILTTLWIGAVTGLVKS
jgi:sRNA-binding regulator protein Hfq